jgi:hypothetical protein
LNYKNETIRTLQTFPSEYSLGDVLFSALQKEAVKNGQSLNFLRNISDEDMYTRVEQVLSNLEDTTPTEEEYLTWINSK